jgi:hypothetical protein
MLRLQYLSELPSMIISMQPIRGSSTVMLIPNNRVINVTIITVTLYQLMITVKATPTITGIVLHLLAPMDH